MTPLNQILQGMHPEFTDEERIRAISDIVAEWPYYDPNELYEADGDSAENIAVFLQMRINRLQGGLNA